MLTTRAPKVEFHEAKCEGGGNSTIKDCKLPAIAALKVTEPRIDVNTFDGPTAAATVPL